MNRWHRLATLVPAVLLGGCVSAVSSLENPSAVVLEQEEGFLLIEVDTTHNLDAIYISGEKKIKLTSADLRAGSNYILVNLPAGSYDIDRVDLNGFWYYKLEDELWEFSVEAGVVSYVGNLRFEGGTWGFSGHFALINRSSFALEYLDENHPELLETRRMEYRGPGNDRFFDVIASTEPTEPAS
jgi:hypothetical protein